MKKSIAGTRGSASLQSEIDQSKHFICGAGSSVINIIITFPLNKVMFRQQLYGFRTPKALKQLWGEGVVNLYRGIIPPLFQKTTSIALMFGLFNHSQNVLVNDFKMNSYAATLVSSMVAGSCEATLIPFERIQTLLLDPKHHNTFKNSYHAFSSIHGKYGVQEYFRGITAVLLRNGPSNVIFFSLREPIKMALPTAEENTVHNSVNDFISGALIGALCSTIFFPINVVKTRMQSSLGGKFHTVSSTFRLVFRERNQSWRKMYRGSHINLGRSFLSWGIINASYEYLMKTFFT